MIPDAEAKSPVANVFMRSQLRSHFGFANVPFIAHSQARTMIESRSQQEMLAGLGIWTELGGIAVAVGPSGCGKSITVRRFIHELDEDRHHVFDLPYLSAKPYGFLRSLSRVLGLPLRHHGADLFDAARDYLQNFEHDHGPHPVLIIDDAEGLSVPVLELLRRMTCLPCNTRDERPRFSLLLTGTEDLLTTLRGNALVSLRSRVVYVHTLRAFGFDDTRNYVRERLQRAGADPKLFADDAIRHLFTASRGLPRTINQLALHLLIRATFDHHEVIEGDFAKDAIADHPFQGSDGANP